MEIIKKCTILIVILVAVYYGFQYFSTTDDESYEEEDIPSYALPAIPEACRDTAKDFENAVYGNQSNRVSEAQLNRTHRVFMSCLKDSGFSDAEIRGVIRQLKEKALGLAGKDGFF